MAHLKQLHEVIFRSEYGVLKTKSTILSPLDKKLNNGNFRIIISDPVHVLDSKIIVEENFSDHADLLSFYLNAFQVRMLGMSKLGFEAAGYDRYEFEGVVVKRYLNQFTHDLVFEMFKEDGFHVIDQIHGGFHDSLIQFTLRNLKTNFELLPSKMRDKICSI